MEVLKSEIWNDALIRYVPFEGNNFKGELVMTKDEFLACYTVWVKNNPEMSTNSTSNSFFASTGTDEVKE